MLASAVGMIEIGLPELNSVENGAIGFIGVMMGLISYLLVNLSDVGKPQVQGLAQVLKRIYSA